MVFATVLLAACAMRVTSVPPAPSPAPAAVQRPIRLWVVDFQIDSGAVQQDQGIGPRLQRFLAGADNAATRAATAREVQSAFSDAMVQRLRKAGLPAEPASPDAADQPASQPMWW